MRSKLSAVRWPSQSFSFLLPLLWLDKLEGKSCLDSLHIQRNTLFKTFISGIFFFQNRLHSQSTKLSCSYLVITLYNLTLDNIKQLINSFFSYLDIHYTENYQEGIWIQTSQSVQQQSCVPVLQTGLREVLDFNKLSTFQHKVKRVSKTESKRTTIY